MGSVCSPNVYLKGYHGPANEKLMDLVGIKNSEVEAEFGISFASLVLYVWVGRVPVVRGNSHRHCGKVVI